MSGVDLDPSLLLLFLDFTKDRGNRHFLFAFWTFFCVFEDEIPAFEVSDILEPAFLAQNCGVHPWWFEDQS